MVWHRQHFYAIRRHVFNNHFNRIQNRHRTRRLHGLIARKQIIRKLAGLAQDDRLMLVLEDDGCGLPLGSTNQGFGLAGMRERVTALGGTLTISCTHGTLVRVNLPLRYT